MQLPQQGGKIHRLPRKALQLLQLLLAEAVLRRRRGQAVGIVPRQVQKGCQVLQLLRGKGQAQHGRLRRGGGGIDLAAEAGAQAPVGGIEALLHGRAHGVHRLHGGLKGGPGAVGSSPAVVRQAAVAYGTAQAQRNQSGGNIGSKNKLGFLRHKKHLFWSIISKRGVFMNCREICPGRAFISAFQGPGPGGGESPPGPGCGRSPQLRRGSPPCRRRLCAPATSPRSSSLPAPGPA